MTYRIRYYDDGGKEIGSTPWGGSVEEARRIAENGLVRHSAASVRIFDEDQRDRQVWPRVT